MAGTAARPLLCVTSCPEGQLGLEPGLGPQYGDQDCLYVHLSWYLPRLDTPSLGVLHSGSADFESVDDLVEAVGELLQEVSGDSKDDAGIRAVCQRMYNTLRLYVPGQGDSGRWESGRSGDKT